MFAIFHLKIHLMAIKWYTVWHRLVSMMSEMIWFMSTNKSGLTIWSQKEILRREQSD